MLPLILRRLLATVPVMGVVALFVFALLRLTPGDPAAIIARIRAALGLDRPLLVQIGIWLGQLLRGDLGTSIFSGLPVITLIKQRLEPTVALTILAMLLAVLTAVPLGVLAGVPSRVSLLRLARGTAGARLHAAQCRLRSLHPAPHPAGVDTLPGVH